MELTLVDCALSDGQINYTKTLQTAEGFSRKCPSKIRKEHYSICEEPDGRYLFHFTTEKVKKNTNETH